MGCLLKCLHEVLQSTAGYLTITSNAHDMSETQINASLWTQYPTHTRHHMHKREADMKEVLDCGKRKGTYDSLNP